LLSDSQGTACSWLLFAHLLPPPPLLLLLLLLLLLHVLL
jgi:hypothetical protein